MGNANPGRVLSRRGGARDVRCIAGALLIVLAGAPLRSTAQPSVKVTQITHGPQHHYFGYIGQSRTVPWNASGRYLLALQVGFQDRLPGTDDPADICVIDAHNNYAIRVVDRTRGWNPQQGTMFYWNPAHPETQFFFNDREPRTGKVFTVLFDIAANNGKGERVREYRFDDTPVANGGVAQNGGYFTAINYARMARLRPVTGYADAWDWTQDVGAPADDGIFRVDIGTGEKTLIVSFAQLKGALRGTVENLDARQFFINHTLNNRNNDLIYFFCRADFEQQVNGPRVNAVFTVRPDGSALTRHETFIGGHPEWGWGPQIIGSYEGRQVVYDTASRQIVESLGGADVFRNPEDPPRGEVAAGLSREVEPGSPALGSGARLESHERRHRRTRDRGRRDAPDVPARAVRPSLTGPKASPSARGVITVT
jgi:hypothetical protein